MTKIGDEIEESWFSQHAMVVRAILDANGIPHTDISNIPTTHLKSGMKIITYEINTQCPNCLSKIEKKIIVYENKNDRKITS